MSSKGIMSVEPLVAVQLCASVDVCIQFKFSCNIFLQLETVSNAGYH